MREGMTVCRKDRKKNAVRVGLSASDKFRIRAERKRCRYAPNSAAGRG